MNTHMLSQAETEKIQEEIRSAVNTVIKGCETLDMDLAFQALWDSPDFRMIGMDGALCDYHTYVKNNIDYLMTCSQFTLTTLKEDITVFNDAFVIYSWIYSVDATLKTGEHDIFEQAGASFVFTRINGEWKVVYYHESTLPPTRQSR